FNHGYYWEAHEAWEGLWQRADKGSPLRILLKGLILSAAAGVKIREGKGAPAVRHAGRAAGLFRQLMLAPERGYGQALGMSPAALADQAVAVARETFDRTGWAASPRLRAAVLFELADRLEAARDDIADIMVNGASRVFIEVGGKVQLTNVRFRDNTQLMNICQRIVSQVGRRVDESSPICDARLPDGSRVNVIAPPLAIDGPTLTIRKFKKDKLTMKNLVEYASISPEGARVLGVIGASRCNLVISGGTGSGKTTLLNTLTAFIDPTERVVTCEDAAELQLQQPHVVRLETRPPNLEGQGQITMRDLVKNCLRMRPERIIVGEVRGPEAFDLLQAMNTGHDGSMGTLHANSPREAISRMESMITMGGYGLPSKTIREMIVGSVDVIVQAARLRDGSRRITHITEVVGLEGDVIVTQDLFVYEITGEDENGRVVGRHRSTGIARPRFWDRARYYGLERELAEALDAAE
ncbi:MAG: ATPase, T2SS/T4P/T4SS family, partial [Brevundimonas sp.]